MKMLYNIGLITNNENQTNASRVMKPDTIFGGDSKLIADFIESAMRFTTGTTTELPACL